MTRKIETDARDYLLKKFRHPRYEFRDTGTNDVGFDLWLINKKQPKSKTKVELKAHGGTYRRPSNLFERLIFNAEIERSLFESGETVIARVFVGSTPYKVFIITNEILSAGAKLQPEARYVLRGRTNYKNSFEELT